MDGFIAFLLGCRFSSCINSRKPPQYLAEALQSLLLWALNGAHSRVSLLPCSPCLSLEPEVLFPNARYPLTEKQKCCHFPVVMIHCFYVPFLLSILFCVILLAVLLEVMQALQKRQLTYGPKKEERGTGRTSFSFSLCSPPPCKYTG